MKYVKTFETHSEYESYIEDISINLLPNVSYCKTTHDVHYNPYDSYDYSKAYLTLEALESGVFDVMVTADSSSELSSLSYSLDNGNTWTTTTNVQEISEKETYYLLEVTTPTVNVGDKVLLKGNVDSTADYSFIPININFNVSGNPFSLFYNDDFRTVTGVSDSRLRYLFSGSNVVSAKNLSLFSTTLTDNCYEGMFQDCTSLTTAPELPATTLTISCYFQMFYGCTSLTSVPDNYLPATTLATSCYQSMFYGCTSLTSTPELPATTLAQTCYNGMFYGCTSLTTVSQLPATTLAQHCYMAMFRGCTSLRVVPSNLLPATQIANECYRAMFWGCTALTTAPDLPATIMFNSCYYDMFTDCTSLTTAPVLPATTLTTHCYSNMFNGCSQLNYIKAMFTTTPTNSLTIGWVEGVAATGTFVKNSAAQWNVTSSASNSYIGIPSGWTVQTASE